MKRDNVCTYHLQLPKLFAHCRRNLCCWCSLFECCGTLPTFYVLLGSLEVIDEVDVIVVGEEVGRVRLRAWPSRTCRSSRLQAFLHRWAPSGTSVLHINGEVADKILQRGD